MKVFCDTNVWNASFIARGLCADFVGAMMSTHAAGRVEVLVCPAVVVETKRLLRHKFHANDKQWMAAETVFHRVTTVPDGATAMPPGFPDPDDWPIVAAAVETEAGLFVTGDRALLDLGAVEGLPIIDPRAAFLKLREMM